MKHVTVNADQAVVADTVVTGKGNKEAASLTRLLTTGADKPMETIEPTQKEAVPVRGEVRKAK